MKLTLKENMILNKVIGNYIIDNNLFFDECKTLNKIVIVSSSSITNPTFKNVFFNIDWEFRFVMITEGAIKQMLTLVGVSMV